MRRDRYIDAADRSRWCGGVADPDPSPNRTRIVRMIQGNGYAEGYLTSAVGTGLVLTR